MATGFVPVQESRGGWPSLVGQPLLPWVKAQAKCHASSLVAEEHDAVVATRLPIGGSDTGDFREGSGSRLFLFPRLAGFSDGLCLKQIILFCFLPQLSSAVPAATPSY